jgi:hypothetical protein
MYKLILLLLIFTGSVFGQAINRDTSDSLEFLSPPELEPLNRKIEGLTENEQIRQFENKHNQKLSNIITCISYLYFDLSPEQKRIITDRLKEIAIKLVERKEPVIILTSGKNSWEEAKRLNGALNPHGITYVSMGNSCLGNERQEEGIHIFNKQTLNSLGIETLVEKSQTQDKIQKKKKRKR